MSDKRLDILRQAASSKPASRFEESRNRRKPFLRQLPKILAQVNPSHDLGRVDIANLRPEVGNLIRERDQSREQSVGCVLDHLRSSRVGPQARHARRKGRVKSLQDIRRPFIDAAEHEAIRKQEIVDSRAFGEKFRIHAQSKICPAPLAGRIIQYRSDDFVGCARHHRALDHHHMVLIDLGPGPHRSRLPPGGRS